MGLVKDVESKKSLSTKKKKKTKRKEKPKPNYRRLYHIIRHYKERNSKTIKKVNKRQGDAVYEGKKGPMTRSGFQQKPLVLLLKTEQKNLLDLIFFFKFIDRESKIRRKEINSNIR